MKTILLLTTLFFFTFCRHSLSNKHMDANNDDIACNEFDNPTDSNPKKCLVCESDATKRCSKCKTAYYCSIECQKKDWESHKKNCGNIKSKLSTIIERNESKPKENLKKVMEYHKIVPKIASPSKITSDVCCFCGRYAMREIVYCSNCDEKHFFCSDLCEERQHTIERNDLSIKQHGVLKTIYNYLKENLSDNKDNADYYFIIKYVEPKLRNHIMPISDYNYKIQFDEKLEFIDNIDKTSSCGKTLTSVAAEYGYWRTLLLLLESGADSCYAVDNKSLAYFAAKCIPYASNIVRSYRTYDDYRGKIDCLQILFAHGAPLTQDLIFNVCFEPYPNSMDDNAFYLLTNTLIDRYSCPNYVRNLNSELGKDILYIISEYINEDLSFKVPDHIVFQGLRRLEAICLGQRVVITERVSVADKLKRLLTCLIECYIHKYEDNDDKKGELLNYLKSYDLDYIFLHDYLEGREDEYSIYLSELLYKVHSPLSL